ncbi:MAG: hypothetical protein HQL13_07980 [Candidatus Omnitrophica bacterium]|nr:hypothetical protein [Candidatus Omnitrophota bacterium]
MKNARHTTVGMPALFQSFLSPISYGSSSMAIAKSGFKYFQKFISSIILTAFIVSLVQWPSMAKASVSTLPDMPQPGTMVPLSQAFTPAILKGISIHPENPLKFDFVIYKGDRPLSNEEKRIEYTKLAKYFMASLAIPDDDQWVNLSPYEKNRIIQDDFGKTEMGRDLLAQDYMLKAVTASLIYPQDKLGAEFWSQIYSQAQKNFGSSNIPVNTFNKVWILPDDAVVYETGNTAYVLKTHLRVMLEEDYLSLQKHNGLKARRITHSIASKIVKSIVLPALQREVNEGKNFAALRQVYSGMVLAAWYKRTLKESLLGKLYANKAKVQGIDQDPKANEEIYHQYLKAYRKGVFNFIKEDVDKYTHERIPRKYFSGGEISLAMASRVLRQEGELGQGQDVLLVTRKLRPQDVLLASQMSQAAALDVATIEAQRAPDRRVRQALDLLRQKQSLRSSKLARHVISAYLSETVQGKISSQDLNTLVDLVEQGRAAEKAGQYKRVMDLGNRFQQLMGAYPRTMAGQDEENFSTAAMKSMEEIYYQRVAEQLGSFMSELNTEYFSYGMRFIDNYEREDITGLRNESDRLQGVDLKNRDHFEDLKRMLRISDQVARGNNRFRRATETEITNLKKLVAVLERLKTNKKWILVDDVREGDGIVFTYNGRKYKGTVSRKFSGLLSVLLDETGQDVLDFLPDRIQDDMVMRLSRWDEGRWNENLRKIRDRGILDRGNNFTDPSLLKILKAIAKLSVGDIVRLHIRQSDRDKKDLVVKGRFFDLIPDLGGYGKMHGCRLILLGVPQLETGVFAIDIRQGSFQPIREIVTVHRTVFNKAMASIDKIVQGTNQSQVGGIDFNAAQLSMQIKRDGHGVVLPISQQELEKIHIAGLVPMLMGITPALSTQILSGLQLAIAQARAAKI